MHPVAELIRDRVRSGSQPGGRVDGHKLGLAIEGGGMRGVVSAGMVAGLEALSCLSAFDAVYGSSAGAINGAYFIAGQAAYGTTIYYENINNNRFVDSRRAFSGRPIMSLSFLLDDVMVRSKVLDYDRVLDSRIDLHVVTSSLAESRVHIFSDFPNMESLREAFRASATIPFVGGPPISIDGKEYLDAMLFESIPYRAALSDGCTHIAVLRTRPLSARLGDPSMLTRVIVAPSLAKLNPDLREVALSRNRRYNADADELDELERSAAAPFVMSIAPACGAPVVQRTEKDRARLVSGACSGAKAVAVALGADGSQAIEVVRPYDGAGFPLVLS